jgi:hypothetical protein
MTQSTHVWDTESEPLGLIDGLHSQGTRILCPKRGSELIVALDAASSKEHRVHPGIYCPGNLAHVSVVVELAETRDRWRKLLASFRDAHRPPDGA